MRSRAAIDHPAWCSPAHCQVIDPHTPEHRSTPVTYRTDAGDVEITVQRVQVDPAPWRFYRAAVVHQELTEQISLTLTDDDVAMLSAMLGLTDAGFGHEFTRD